MRRFLAILIVLSGCTADLSELCTVDTDCTAGLKCLKTVTPPTQDEATNGTQREEIRVCVLPCAADAECTRLSVLAKCRAKVDAVTFCADPGADH